MDETTRFLLASGAVAAAVAALAWWGDYRRIRRSNLDKVGWVPWTSVFFWALMAAVLLLGAAAPGLLAGS